MRRAGDPENGAHRYADAGWHVFPCRPGSKEPATPHGFLDATTDHRTIQRWWRAEPRANVAVATGHPGPDVLDVDVRANGNGFAAFNQLKHEGLVPGPAAVIRTPSGGAHFYYQGTGQRNGHIPGRHLDFRSTGGYVISPPSEIGGRPYIVARHQPSTATFNWAAARELLDPQPHPQPSRSPRPDGPRDVSHLAAWVAAQPEGNRNAGLFWAANRAIEAGDTSTLDGLLRAAQDAGLDAREADRTIRSAQQTAMRGADRPSQPQPRSLAMTAAGPAGEQQAQLEEPEAG